MYSKIQTQEGLFKLGEQVSIVTNIVTQKTEVGAGRVRG